MHCLLPFSVRIGPGPGFEPGSGDPQSPRMHRYPIPAMSPQILLGKNIYQRQASRKVPAGKAIFLDFSNTITTVESENKSMSLWLDLIVNEYRLKEDIRRNFAKARMEKLVDRETRFRSFMQINHEVLSELYGIAEIFEEEYYRSHERNLRLRPDFVDFIEEAKNDYEIVMVTDADNTYTERTLSALGIDKYFDSIVTAEMVKSPKPDPRIFRAAMKEAHDPTKVVFIGDSERRDIEGAKKMGFIALKMDDDSSSTVADMTIHNFRDASLKIKKLLLE